MLDKLETPRQQQITLPTSKGVSESTVS